MSDSIITLDAEKPTAGGRMLARHNGQIALVWGAIPGERVRARVERTAKGVLFAETVDVISPSADRRPAVGDWRCGGNVLAHIDYHRQLQIKADIIRDAFTRIARMPLAQLPAVAPSPEHGYRMRARLHVRRGRIGFVREGSHDLCEVGPTGQMLPETVAWIDAAQDEIASRRLTNLTSIEVTENMPATDRACHVEFEPGTDASIPSALSGPTFVSDTIHVRADDPAAVLTLKRDARAFFQGNRFLLESLARHVAARVSSGPVFDLYAGVGLFGLSLVAAGVEDVTLVEGDHISGSDLVENALPYGGRARVERSSVEDVLRRCVPNTGATIIVDPPRTGMSKDATLRIAALHPARIVYVSCDVATLARDARLLVNAGYSLREMSAFDLFPNTAHVETVCVFGIDE